MRDGDDDVSLLVPSLHIFERLSDLLNGVAPVDDRPELPTADSSAMTRIFSGLSMATPSSSLLTLAIDVQRIRRMSADPKMFWRKTPPGLNEGRQPL
jgi:hypothetical protein